MDIGEFEYLQERFYELFSYCSLHDRSCMMLCKGVKMSDIFLMDISCYLLYLSSSPRKLLNKLYLFRDEKDCNRLIMEKIIDIVSENLSFAGNHFEKPLVAEILSSIKQEKYVLLVLEFFRLLGNAVIREQIK